MASKTKKEKYKKTNPDDPWITRTWNTEKGRASLKLAFYGLFVVFVFMLIILGKDSNPTVYKSTYSAKDYEKDFDMQITELKNNNYSFNYNIDLNGNKILFYGKKNINVESGYKEDSNGIIKYLKDNDKTYKINIDGKEEITNLYEGINNNYLSVNYILNLIANIKPNKENKVYNYLLENNVNISIETSGNEINKITIKDNLDTYELTFADVGKITKDNLEM